MKTSTFLFRCAVPLLALFAAGPVQATLVAYWDMDASSVGSKRSPSGGSQAGTVVMDFAYPPGWGTDITDVAGTPVNVVPPEGTSNRAVSFDTGLSVLQNADIITITGLDFTGLRDVEVSFAALGDAAFSWNSEIHLDYSIVGSYVDWAETESNTGGVWELDSFSMPSALDGESNVSLRIRTSNTVSILAQVDFDNIQITAVPEPGHFGLFAAWLALGLLVLQRRAMSGLR